MINEYDSSKDEKLSDHFSTKEFHCHCGCPVTYIDTDLIDYLEKKRELWKRPITIISGFRCVGHNKKQGGKKGSYHLVGKAADIKVEGMTTTAVGRDCVDAGGLGVARSFIHVDVRPGKARWTY